MKKYILTLLIIPVLISCNSKKQNDVASVDSKDSIVTKVSVLSDSDIPDEKELQIYWLCDSSWKKIKKVEEKLFNGRGDILRWKQYAGVGRPLVDDFTYEYLQHVKSKKYFKRGPENMTVFFFYGQNGRLEKEVEYAGDKPETISKYYYKSDKETKPYKLVNFKAGENVPLMYWEYEYDEYGHLIKEDEYDSDGIFQSDSYEYNSDGLMIKHSAYASGQDGGVQYFNIYDGKTLIKDSVVIFDSPTEYHIYERLKI